MSDALVAYWTAWNEPDLDRIAQHLVLAVTKDVEWNDPRDSFIGIDELEVAIRRLRSSKPDHGFVIASEIDHQHGRLRYRWDMIHHGRTLMEGVDVVTLDAPSGLIARVDGFFGQPTPIEPVGTSIPLALRAAPIGTDRDGEADPHQRAGLRRIAPIFPVHDITASLAYYALLGFTTRAYEGGGYGFATADGVEIHLGLADRGATRASAYLFVEDADELARTWQSAGVTVNLPEDTEWGQREGAVVDPDDNVIRFGSPLRHSTG
jgi:hypothetical protein